MNKIFRKTIFLLAVAIMGVWGCYDDKGNYDYIDLPEINIDTTGLNIVDEKLAYQFEVLKLDPTINYPGDKGVLKYEWKLYPQKPQKPDNQTNYDSVEILSTEPVFNEIIYDVPGNYYMTLAVHDTKYDVKTYWTCKVKVESALSSGLCVLDEKEGINDIHLIKDKRLLPALDADLQGVTYNIYTKVNTDRPLNNAQFLGFKSSIPWGGENSFYVFEEDGGCSLMNTTYEVGTEYDNLFTVSFGLKYKPQFYAPLAKGPTDVLISDSVIYAIESYMMAPTTFSEILGDYTAAPFVAEVNTTWNYAGIFFDVKHHRFMYLKPMDSKFAAGEFNTVTPGGVFNINNINKDLVWLEAGFNYITYGVFKDASAYQLYVTDFTQGSTTEDPTPAKAMAIYDMNNCPGVNESSLFAFGSLGNVCYYSAGDKLYQYRYADASNKATPIDGFPVAGEEITCMKILKKANHVQNGKLLMVATYKGGEGKVYLINFNELTGTLDIANMGEPYTGFGRIKDLQLKN